MSNRTLQGLQKEAGALLGSLAEDAPIESRFVRNSRSLGKRLDDERFPTEDTTSRQTQTSKSRTRQAPVPRAEDPHWLDAEYLEQDKLIGNLREFRRENPDLTAGQRDLVYDFGIPSAEAPRPPAADKKQRILQHGDYYYTGFFTLTDRLFPTPKAKVIQDLDDTDGAREYVKVSIPHDAVKSHVRRKPRPHRRRSFGPDPSSIRIDDYTMRGCEPMFKSQMTSTKGESVSLRHEAGKRVFE